MDREKIMAIVQPHLSNDEHARAIALGVTPVPRWIIIIPTLPVWIILIALWTGLWPRQWDLIVSIMIGLFIGLLLSFIVSRLMKASRYLVVATESRFHLIELESWKFIEKSYKAWDLTAIRRGAVVQNKSSVTLHFYPPEEHIELSFMKMAPIGGNENLALKIDRILKDPKVALETSTDDPFTAVAQTHTTASTALPATVPEGSTFLISDGRGWQCSACHGYLRPDATFCKHCKKPIVIPNSR